MSSKDSFIWLQDLHLTHKDMRYTDLKGVIDSGYASPLMDYSKYRLKTVSYAERYRAIYNHIFQGERLKGVQYMSTILSTVGTLVTTYEQFSDQGTYTKLSELLEQMDYYCVNYNIPYPGSIYFKTLYAISLVPPDHVLEHV